MATITEVFKRDFTQDALADLEDMSFAELTLLKGVMFGLKDLGGEKVVLEHVDPNSQVHTAVVQSSGLKVEFSNTEDIYE